jgi:hypothetical protein
MAEPVELASFMSRVVGPELEARNDRITHVKSLRQRPLLVATVSDLPASSARLDTEAFRSFSEATEDSVTVQAVYSAATPLHALAQPMALHAAELTETSAVVPTFRAPQRRGQRWMWAGVATATAIGLVWGTALLAPGAASPDANKDMPPEAKPLVSPAAKANDSPTANANGAAVAVESSGREGAQQPPSVGATQTVTPRKGKRGRGANSATNRSSHAAEGSLPVGSPPASKVTGHDKPKLASSPYAGSKSGE